MCYNLKSQFKTTQKRQPNSKKVLTKKTKFTTNQIKKMLTVLIHQKASDY